MSTAQINTFGVPIEGIVHVGANRGQEIPEYAGETDRCILVEPIPALIGPLRQKVAEHGKAYQVLEACCSDTTGEEIEFFIASGGGDSSSMLPLGRVQDLYPSISYVDSIRVRTVTLDDLLARHDVDPSLFNVLAVDTQGADLKVLHGAQSLLEHHIDFIYVEVSVEPLYEHSCTLDEISAFLAGLGFTLHHLNINVMGWGNALYCRRRFLFEDRVEDSIAPTGQAMQSSTHGNLADFGAQNALNGRFRQIVGSRTKLQDQAYWQLDLGAVHPVSRAYWLDRRRRMFPPHPIDVRISDDGETWADLVTLDGETPRRSSTLITRIDIGRPTRFIRLQAQGRHSLAISQFYVLP